MEIKESGVPEALEMEIKGDKETKWFGLTDPPKKVEERFGQQFVDYQRACS
jgi:hypothetical protein